MFYIQGNNIEMTRGDTLHAVINMRDPLGVISYPETGDVVTFNAMLTRDGEAVITKTIPHDTMTLTLDSEDTEDLAYGRYIFTVKIVRTGGDVDTFIDDGTLTLVKTWRHKPHDAYVPWNPWIPLNSMNGWLAPGGAAPVDAALNTSSTHPVQNKALYQALAGKVDNVEGMGLSHNDLTDALAQKLTDIETGATKTIVDALFVSGSTNPVQSKTIQAALAAKVDKEVGKGLSSNDYTSAEQSKLAGIEAGAQVNPDLSGYATRSEMNTALAGKADSSSVHNVPAGGTAGQVLKKRSGTDYDAEWAEESGGGGGSVTVDDALSGTSENPVQNKVVKAALDGKIDDVRINGSSIVSSGIANIPKASESNFGVAKVYAYGDPPIRMVKLENSGNEVFSVPMLDASGHIRLSVLTEATTSAKGAMSASDKSKLDGIEAEANKTTVDSALSTTSANPVQNKVVKEALDIKITSPSSPTAGQFLVYNGSAWVAQTVPNANGVSF